MREIGRVYLVGAGPGEPGLITARGLELLRSCDCVLYDRLVGRALLDEAPEKADRIFVGKEPGQPHSRQVVADALMIERAHLGQRVVRLKGGDPFVFGRGGEELKLLADAGVPYEIVPGVSSAIAAGAYAGIPVTHRGAASSFAVIAANEDPDDDGGTPDASAGRVRLEELATAADTLVLMMGVRSLDTTTKRLIAGGRAPHTPAAMVENGTLGLQRVISGTLETIADLCREANVRSPATAFIGEVVGMRKLLAWFEDHPLRGLRMVVTRPRHQSAKFGDLLSKAGAEVVFMPVIAIVDPESFQELDLAVRKLNQGLYAWVVFTSSNSITRFFTRLRAAGLDARAFGRTKVATVGAASARVLADFGISADLVPETFTGDVLARSMDRGRGGVLVPRVEDAPTDVLRQIKNSGWTPESCVAYRKVRASGDTPEADLVRSGDFDVVTFASASAVEAFMDIVGEPLKVGLAPASDGTRFVACIGPKTAEAARRNGLRIDVIASEHTSEGLFQALVRYFST